MFTESAELYDAIYSTFKHYDVESATIAQVVRAAHPRARTMLDVACGTGEHVRHLRDTHTFEVDGLDLDPGILAVAQRKVPAARFFAADMTAFALPYRYDVVACLFSSIGYVRTLDRVTAALRCFRDHLVPGGVVIVEPWFTPGVLQSGREAVNEAELNGARVTRTSRLQVDGRISTILFDYRIEDAGGVRTMREEHVLGVFSVDEILAAFHGAGLSATHDPVGLMDRGLYVATLAGGGGAAVT